MDHKSNPNPIVHLPQVSARQSSGRLQPVFPSLLSGSKKEEDYVARQVERDKNLYRPR